MERYWITTVVFITTCTVELLHLLHKIKIYEQYGCSKCGEKMTGSVLVDYSNIN